MNAANAPDSTDRQVIIPKDAKLSIMPVTFDNMKNVQLTIDGTLYASEHYKDYIQTDHVMRFNNADGL